jgi:hypothetical protein
MFKVEAGRIEGEWFHEETLDEGVLLDKGVDWDDAALMRGTLHGMVCQRIDIETCPGWTSSKPSTIGAAITFIYESPRC